MDLTTWTDAELIALREKLHAWCLQRQAAKWGNRFWKLTAFIGAFSLIDGIVGIVGIFPDSDRAFSILEIILGSAVCLSWYLGDKKYKSNTNFLDKLNDELSRRGHSL